MDIPTNAARTDLWARSGLARTNYCPHAENLFATSAAWRTTTTIESGFFRTRPCDAWEDGHRHELHGWYQGVGMEAEREIIPGSGVSVGLGVSVGRATLH
jgi:hypothetical protein